MSVPLAMATGFGQGWPQVGALLVAFGLSSVIGLEREVRGKRAGLRTQAIVGTASALIVLVSKFGFSDVLASGQVVLDPSRVAAQIVSGIGFLGAGLIITRQGAIHGLTTAAAVWETAAIGMAAGAGLPLLALLVTVLHFVIVLGFTPLLARLPIELRGVVRLHLVYEDGKGVLRQVISACSSHGWSVVELSIDPPGIAREFTSEPTEPTDPVGVTATLAGTGVHRAPAVLGTLTGVLAIAKVDDTTE